MFYNNEWIVDRSYSTRQYSKIEDSSKIFINKKNNVL